MFKLFTYNHPLVYLLLLVLAFVFRIPSFEAGFISQDETVLLKAAGRMSENAVLYTGIVTDDPPFLVWFWFAFYSLFEEFTLPAIRIFTCIYLFFAAFIFNQLVNDMKLVRERSLFPGILFLCCVSFPWYAQETNGALLILLPLLLSVYLLIRTFDDGVKPLWLLLWVGLLTSFSVLLNYQAIIFYVSMPLIYFIIRPAKISEIFTLLIGFIIPLFFVSVLLYFNQALYAWWDISILYQLDEFLNKGLVFVNPAEYGHKFEIVFGISTIGLPLIGGFLAFRIGAIRLNIQQRKIESVMAIWLCVSIFIVIINGIFKHTNPLIVIVFPLCFYVYRFFLLKFKLIFINIILISVFIYPVWSATQYYILSNPDSNIFVADKYDKDWNKTLNYIIHPDPKNLAAYKFIYADSYPNKPRIWVCGNIPVYMDLFNQGSRYVDFMLFCNKVEFLKANQYRSLISKEFLHPDLYYALQEDLPDYIIDESEIFSEIKNQIPILLKNFNLIYIGNFKIYKRINS